MYECKTSAEMDQTIWNTKHVKGVIATAVVGAKMGKLMRHLRKAIYNLTQHFYNLKQVKTPVVIQQNESDNTLRS